jgi:exonuclease SbcC
MSELARSRSEQADPADPTPLAEVLARKTKEAETIRNRLAEHRRIIARRETHLTEWRAAQSRLDNLKDQGHRAEAAVTRGISERNRLATGVAEQTRSLEETRQILADTLARYGEPVPGEAENNVKESIRRLEERASSHQAQKERMTVLSAEEAKLRETIAGVETALEEWKQRESGLLSELSAITEQVETLWEKRKVLFGNRDPAAEEQRINDAVAKAEALLTGAMESRSAGERRRESAAALLAAEKSAAKTLADQVARRRAKLTAAAQESGFRDVTELLDSRLDETDRVEIEARLQAATDRLHSAETLQAEVTSRLAEKTRAHPAPRPLQEIETEIEAQEAKIATLQQRVGAAEETLRRQREIRENHRVAEREVSERENDYRRWNHLRRLIGSHKGDEFRKFAQGLTLEQLLFHANGHLKRLSGRYRLCRRTGDHMGLDILDTHQADARRPTQTLSGGESFQVSLALALALSDLAGRRRKVESLFLDEGFGQLDQHALDTALGTLETLRSRGRTIGVISHVSALKERIPVQIQVERQTGGAGRIVIRGY